MAILDITGIVGMKFYFSSVMNGMYNINLIPFKDASIMMMFLNVLLFIPYGFLLSGLFIEDKSNWKKAITIGFLTSLSIEVLQLFGGRYAEIDDLLMNSLGVIIGYMIYYFIIDNMFKNHKIIKEYDSGV